MPEPLHPAQFRGDLPVDDFRRYAAQLVDWIAEYLAHPERYRVVPDVRPGDIAAQLPPAPPARGESLADILADIERVIVPGTTHWNHPGFFAYFSISSSIPGILGEMLAAALDVNAMLWKTGPRRRSWSRSRSTGCGS
jgi:aromatic-L-amino-acid decarboxylase